MRFKILKTEVEISFALLCAAALCVITGVFGSFLWCALAIIIHESGHLATMAVLGYLPKRIKISLFEISISDGSRQERTDRENILIIFFGPAANFICFIVFYLLYLTGSEFFLPFAAANLAVGLFNSLPLLSLDGGQILYIFLCRRYTPEKSERIVNIITFIIVFPMSAAGFVLLFNSHYNFSLLFVSAYIILSFLSRQEKYY